VEEAAQRNEDGDVQRPRGNRDRETDVSVSVQEPLIVPASGYYEWKTIDGQKQPYYFTDKQEPVLSIAGIWDQWTDREDGKTLKSCAMLITSPNMFVEDYHDRMPVLLRHDQIDRWLSGESGKEVLVPAREEMLQAFPVSRRVNSSRADESDHTLIAEI